MFMSLLLVAGACMSWRLPSTASLYWLNNDNEWISEWSIIHAFWMLQTGRAGLSSIQRRVDSVFWTDPCHWFFSQYCQSS